MYLFFIDDTNQSKCSREGLRDLVGVGGIIVHALVARDLHDAVDQICKRVGFPDGEVFKWSPSRDHWMRDHLKEEARANFFREVLQIAREHGALAHVSIREPNSGCALIASPIMDVMALALERFGNFLETERQSGLVIAAQPGGGQKNEKKLLDDCMDLLRLGTAYVRFRRVATNVLTMPFRQSRLLQIADLVASASLALVAGSPHTPAHQRSRLCCSRTACAA